MEKNIDSIIYIVLTILILVISILRKKKKPLSAENEDNEVFQESTIFDLLDPSKREAIFNSEKESIIAEEPKVQSTLDIKENTLQGIDHSAKISEPKKDAYDIEAEGNTIDFDLKEAVVYSEILNRKEY